MSNKEIKVVELFAGVGGFRLGLERASKRFKTVWANQWEPGKKVQHAFSCYVGHFGVSPNHLNEDIEKVKAKIPDHDLLVGGFPCQDYSVARTKAEGITGKKGVLWWSINDIIESKRPKYILLENVDRLIRSPASQRGRDFAVILRCLYEKGYAVEWRVINAAEYGEVQKRRRIFIFAYSENTPFFQKMQDTVPEDIVKREGMFAKVFPVCGPMANRSNTFSVKEKDYSTLLDISNRLSERFYNGGTMIEGNVYTRECRPKSIKEQMILGDIIVKDADEKYFIEDLSKWKYLKGRKHILRARKADGAKYHYSEGAIPLPDPLDRPGRTMLTSEGTVNRCSHIIKDPYKNDRYRRLTPEECELMNGFDVGWTATGMPESARYFTMGNALVVPLVERMGKMIIEIFDMK